MIPLVPESHQFNFLLFRLTTSPVTFGSTLITNSFLKISLAASAEPQKVLADALQPWNVDHYCLGGCYLGVEFDKSKQNLRLMDGFSLSSTTH
jgi:hypothetical protein